MPDQDAGALDRAFDAVMSGFDPAMVVVTAAAGDERDGCLVGFHAQLGIHPRRYVVFLSVRNRTQRLARAATHLAVHALGAGDHALAERFGGETEDDPDVDKLAGVEWAPGPGGAPLLVGLPQRFTGRVLARLEAPGADHVGYVLEPVEVHVGDLAGPLRLHQVTDIDPGHEA